MQDSFYPGFWSGRPARPRAAPPAMARPSRPAKVVSVPVHFVSSDENKPEQSIPTVAAAVFPRRQPERITKSAAALRIQRAFRGFLVRKNLSAVRRIEAEVDAVEREVAKAGDRLRRDARERLRVSETLMSLLFRLDSVRGVRDYRRRVIRRAIALQEAVDAIAAGEESGDGAAAARNDVGERSEGNAPRETLESQAPMSVEIPQSMDSNLDALADHGGEPSRENLEPQAPMSMDIQQSMDSDLEALADNGVETSCRDENSGKKAEEEDSSAGMVVAEEFKQEEGEGAATGTMEGTQVFPTKEALGMEGDSEKGSGALVEALQDHDGDQLGDAKQASMSQAEGNGAMRTGESPAMGEMPACPLASAQALDMAVGEAGQGCGQDMRQVMERMVEESRGLKGLVAELCERNEMQLRLMDGLLQRVERLEKVVEKMGRKKQKRQDAKKCCARKCERRL